MQPQREMARGGAFARERSTARQNHVTAHNSESLLVDVSYAKGASILQPREHARQRRLWQGVYVTGRWTDVLQDVAARLNQAQVDWMLVGSAATALRGAAIEPKDIDVALPTSSAVHVAARTLPVQPDAASSVDSATWYSSAAQPTLSFTDPVGSKWTFGRWLIGGVKLELAHIDRPGTADLFIETFGQEVWAARTIIEFNGVQIPVVSLEAQLATMMLRGQQERIAAVLSAVGAEAVDLAMLCRAIDDRRTEGAQLDVPEVVQRILSA